MTVVTGKVQGKATVEGKPKLNSRVTSKHVEQLRDGLEYAMSSDRELAVRMGYLKFAVANVLKDIGIPSYFESIVEDMYKAMAHTERDVTE